MVSCRNDEKRSTEGAGANGLKPKAWDTLGLLLSSKVKSDKNGNRLSDL
ncbi:MAG: hypothetical protein ACFFDN_15580 [Candidatus Hodarchaeota archaeon]